MVKRLLLRMLAVAVLVLLVLSFAIAGLLMEGALHPIIRRRASDTAALAQSITRATGGTARQISIRSREGLILKAWWMAPANGGGNAVIACHGVADSGFGVMGDALLFLRHGYSVLVPDSRGHGESQGFVSYGVYEADDIVLWMRWLRTQGTGNIYGFGESLGGAILLQAVGAGAPFKAVVAESSYASFEQVADERVAHYGRIPGSLADLLVKEGLLYAQVRYRVSLSTAKPVDAVQRSSVPILLIHGLDDNETPSINSRQIASKARCAELWLVRGARHTGAYATAPAEFETRVLNFYDRAQ